MTTAHPAAEPTDPIVLAAGPDAGQRLRRPARFRSIRLGGLTISYVPDGAVGLAPRGWLPDTTAEDWAVHADHLDEKGYLVAGIGGLLVEYGDRALLIDTGVGPATVPDDPGNPLIGAITGGALLENLARAGRAPQDIEAVAFTHLHGDHIGWAAHPAVAGGPVFTAADYLVAETEWAHRHPSPEHAVTPGMLEMMSPKVRTIADGEEIFPGVRAVVAAGHTAGHMSYSITSAGRRLLAFGDALHTPLQIRYPHWSSGVDHDRVRSAQARHRLVDELAATGDLAFGNHFADVVFGTVARDAAGRTSWVPLP
ncbi:MBL fold metallo-hydrolase [Nocardia rhamnosiphila]|uniref:MBL fold metallo-hydrolase n=1 Tax=Nocardia rhamnosiphila TaxID=426716 RepID=UPI00341095AA